VRDPAGKAVVLFGAGGAARAIAVEAARAGAASITVVNRNPSRGAELVELINERTQATARLEPWERTYAVPADTDIVVNATSIGLFPHTDGRPNIDLDSLLPGMVVADIIPNPPKTSLLKSASQRGCTTLDGLGMLIKQGLICVKLWTGVDADPPVMRRTLEELFETSAG